MPENNGPHPALFPVLLAMSQSGENFEKMLDDMIKLIQSARDAMQSMRTGVESFQEGMAKIAYYGMPQRPPAWPGSPPSPVKTKVDATPTPEKDEPAPLNNEISPPGEGMETTIEKDQV